MDVRERKPPRRFAVGPQEAQATLSHCADIALEPDEQVSFVTASGTEFDVVRKAWGYYATPSLNARLPDRGLRPALVGSAMRRYVVLAEPAKLDEFHAYLRSQHMTVIAWLDVDEVAPVKPAGRKT
jgi:hypothetical protein